MRRIATVISALAVGAMVSMGGVAAQSATPIADDSGMIASDPSLCVLAPPSFDALSSIVASPVPDAVAAAVATPGIALPSGQPVDDATREAVMESMEINVACLNTGSILLALAAYTPDGLVRVIGGVGAITQEEYDSLSTPIEMSEDDWAVIVEFQEMVMLPDGRIAALIVGDNQLSDDEPASTTLFYLAEIEGHWYIDDFVNPAE